MATNDEIELKKDSAADVLGSGEFPTRASLLLYFLKGNKRYFAGAIVFAALVALLDLVNPKIIEFTVDSVINGRTPELPGPVKMLVDTVGGVEFLRSHLYFIGGAVLVVAAAGALMRYLFRLCNATGAESLVKRMRDLLYDHIIHLPFSWHGENQTGDIIQRCTSDAERVRTFVSEQMISILRIVIMVAMSLMFMLSMNVKLTMIAAIAVPIVVVYSMVFHGKISAGFETCDENEGVLSTIAQENLTGVRVVRAFGREEFERKRFEKQNVFYTGLWVHLMKLMAWFWSVADFIGGLQILLMLVLGSVFCVRGELTSGEFIAFLSYNGMLIWPVRQLGRVISEMSKAGVSIDRIRYIMNSPAEADRPAAVPAEVTNEAVRGDIVFDHVSFGYEKDQEVLKDINFTIKAGSTLGILGSTGSGKSTLMLLLNRLYEVPEGMGKITIGGVDIADMKAEDLRNNIGMVLQEPFLFSRTVGENISIRDRQMAMDEIRKAAKIACVDEAITDFKKGYDTIVGERGVTLSGGQKQRTAIARMLTQKAPVMIFDDSLSAVDAETDAKIRAQLHEALGTSTVILISHRVTTLMQADKIIVMDKGRIVEEGTPEELQHAGGLYQKIYDIQLSFSEVE